MKNELGSDVKYIKEIETLPTEAGPGGRNDVLFYVESGDIENLPPHALDLMVKLAGWRTY